MNLYDVLNKLSDIANKHKLIGSYHNGDVYRIMNSAKNTYPVVVFTVDMLQNYQDYSTLNAYMYFIDRLTDDEDNKINIQTNGINVINDIINKLCEVNEISVPTPLQYTFFTEKFGDLCCGVYANVSIQFNNYSNCCENFNLNTLTINENGEYILDNIDVVTVDVQPTLQNKTVEYTENGEYSVTNDEEFYGLKQVKINVSIPNVSTAVTITENGTTILTPDSGYYNQVDINVQVPEPTLESKTVDITQNGTMNIAPDSAFGLSNVTVNTNVQPALQEKEISIGINERKEITPDTEYYGLSKVVVQSPNVPLQNKEITITQNGSTRLMPDEGYYALHTVDVNVNVPNPELETKLVKIRENGLTIIEPDSAYGLSKVSVSTNVKPKLQNKTVTITENGTTIIKNDNKFDGLGNVTVITDVAGGGGGTPECYSATYVPTIRKENNSNVIYPYYDTIDVGCIDTSSLTGRINFYDYILSDISHIKGLNKWNISGITSLDLLFNAYSKLENLDLTGWNTSNVTSINNTFYGCRKLSEIKGIENFDTSKVKSLSMAFYDCNNLSNLPIDNWNTSKLEKCNGAFAFTKLTSAPIENWDLSKLNDVTNFYAGMTNLVANSTTSLRDDFLSNTGVTSLYGLYQLCSNIEMLLNPIPTDKTNITNVAYMFYGCQKLNNLMINIGGNQIKDASYMFAETMNANLYNDGDRNIFSLGTCENFNHMFYNCYSGIRDFWEYKASYLNFVSALDCSYMFSHSAFMGFFNNYSIEMPNCTNLSHFMDEINSCSNGKVSFGGYGTDFYLDLPSVVDCSYMFANCGNYNDTTYLDNLSFYSSKRDGGDYIYNNTQNLQTMEGMFENSKLYNDAYDEYVTGDDGNQIRKYYGAFRMYGLNTQSLTNISHLFYNTVFENGYSFSNSNGYPIGIDMSNWTDCSNVTNFEDMFYNVNVETLIGCHTLDEVSGDTSELTVLKNLNLNYNTLDLSSSPNLRLSSIYALVKGIKNGNLLLNGNCWNGQYYNDNGFVEYDSSLQNMVVQIASNNNVTIITN